ncbi:hypothetical protein LOY38_21765 [Pseudomonas sp. B21-015]|uniref:hypothetical protein n=1 Tax=Pseudomonas sp. B21-015 TaxID=2895473 RepID=UPI00215F8B41|nr:hypothetical protein [Pseudomonas sp. B21-015]UVM48969.1 hypothetical protein LOY38_21765 [Pseudomonas sp. B21-015]
MLSSVRAASVRAASVRTASVRTAARFSLVEERVNLSVDAARQVAANLVHRFLECKKIIKQFSFELFIPFFESELFNKKQKTKSGIYLASFLSSIYSQRVSGSGLENLRYAL